MDGSNQYRDRQDSVGFVFGAYMAPTSIIVSDFTNVEEGMGGGISETL